MNWDQVLYWNLILVCLRQSIDEMYDDFGIPRDKRPWMNKSTRTNPKGLPTPPK